jgi:guanylate kinase
MNKNRGRILIISGPSGAGKSSVIQHILNSIDNSFLSISTTSREPRNGEKNGVHYDFVSKNEFLINIRDDKFLEYEKVHDNYYGTRTELVENSLNKGNLVIFDIDVKGHKSIRAKYPDITTSVFLTTQNLSILKERLVKRGTDTPEVIEKRLNNAKEEIKSLTNFDYFVINDLLSKAQDEILKVAELTFLKPTAEDCKNILDSWIDT